MKLREKKKNEQYIFLYCSDSARAPLGQIVRGDRFEIVSSAGEFSLLRKVTCRLSEMRLITGIHILNAILQQ